MNTAVTSKDNKILSTEIIQIDDDDEEDKIESASITEYVEPIKEHDVSKKTSWGHWTIVQFSFCIECVGVNIPL